MPRAIVWLLAALLCSSPVLGAPLQARTAPSVSFADSCGGCPADSYCEFGHEGAPTGSVACVDYGADKGHRLLYRQYGPAGPCTPGLNQELVIAVSGSPFGGTYEFPLDITTNSNLRAVRFSTPASGRLALASVAIYVRVTSTGAGDSAVRARIHAHDAGADAPGAQIYASAGAAVPDGQGDWDERELPPGNAALDPSTAYWLVVEGTTPAGFQLMASSRKTGTASFGYGAVFASTLMYVASGSNPFWTQQTDAPILYYLNARGC